MRRIVVAISGASGAIYGVRLLEVLREDPEIETHSIISAGAGATIEYETGRGVEEVRALADVAHDDRELADALASGSYRTDGMIVAPCSMRTLSGIANSFDENLIVRAADVHLKERRKLVLMVRESPLHLGHLRLMVDATAAGATIFPPVPGFYNRPESIDDLVNHMIGRALDQLGVENDLFERWSGLGDH